MSRQRYTEELKLEAVKQVPVRDHPLLKSLPGWACPVIAGINGQSAMPSLLNIGSKMLIFTLRTGA